MLEKEESESSYRENGSYEGEKFTKEKAEQKIRYTSAKPKGGRGN